MRYWWVNQNQTYRQEVKGGYLWSPKRTANGARNPFYEFMTGGRTWAIWFFPSLTLVSWQLGRSRPTATRVRSQQNSEMSA